MRTVKNSSLLFILLNILCILARATPGLAASLLYFLLGNAHTSL